MTQFFYKMKYDLKGHIRLYKTTFISKAFYHIRSWTDFDKKNYDC